MKPAMDIFKTCSHPEMKTYAQRVTWNAAKQTLFWGLEPLAVES